MRRLLLLVGLAAFVGGPAPRPTSSFSDPAVAQRAGYELQSVGGAVEHWVNPAYLDDGRERDPARPEALMYRRTASGLELEAIVFVLDRAGETTPHIPGSTWHHHTLCLGPGGLGVPLPGGPCPPGTSPQDTPPMLHVWTGGAEHQTNDGVLFCQLTA